MAPLATRTPPLPLRLLRALLFILLPSRAAAGPELAPKVPAIYVFGDSTADVGNNNYLQGAAAAASKSNFPPNGVDFPYSRPTGRFSNGYNGVDFLGYKEVKSACCGSGKFNGESGCTPSVAYCSDRHHYLFWDALHATHATTKLAGIAIYNGSLQFATPINFKQLAEDES